MCSSTRIDSCNAIRSRIRSRCSSRTMLHCRIRSRTIGSSGRRISIINHNRDRIISGRRGGRCRINNSRINRGVVNDRSRVRRNISRIRTSRALVVVLQLFVVVAIVAM